MENIIQFLQSETKIVLVLLIVSLVFLVLFVLGKLNTLIKKSSTQQANEQALLEKLTLSIELGDKYQQQLQQQLSISQQQQHNHQAEIKHFIAQQISDFQIKFLQQHAEQGEKHTTVLQAFNEKLQQSLHQHQVNFNQNQAKAVDQLIDHLSKASQVTREEQSKSLLLSSEQMAIKINELTQSTDNRLKEISHQVEKRLADGFDKTTKTFNDILKRLALIDEAQNKITELSSNVVSLQEVLSDKRSRGAFGEVQLNSLIRNVIPEQHFSLQHTLSNGKIADCALFLPEPTGTVIIDAKFPLESYRKMTDITLGEFDRKAAERQFKVDIKKHIKDISDKYLIDNETSDGAIMFIPAEAVFAEIHSHHADLVEYGNKRRVWLASPTTLMAILTTARAVIKDQATREQIHIIQAHLSELAGDFSRFRIRFDNLAKHIDQAAVDVKQIHTSAHKISTRFEKIEQVDVSTVGADESEQALQTNN